VGSWPFEPASRDAFVDRICTYMTKALREAKVRTSWLSPDEEYEEAVRRFVKAILDPRRGGQFLDTFLPFQARVAELGIYNGLAQLLIKITAPGIPDFYQGTELWDFNLVDPDNRRPVDYARRRELLKSVTCPQEAGDSAAPASLLAARADGRIKMFVTTRALGARRQLRDVFTGEYVPLHASGEHRDSLFAFARRLGSQYAITCVPRLVASVIPDAAGPPLGTVWLDTRVELPADAPRTFHNVLTGATIDVECDDDRGTMSVPAAVLFAELPVALLVAR
jgi:(1->4)-alpha-D-glucan 1-alpha-D-glucosylmutase